MRAPSYLDYNATTPLDPRVREAMLPWLGDRFGNASSRHEYGRAARRAIDEARQRIAAAVGAHPTEVLFVSGGSEANNMFLKGAAACLLPGHLAVGATEHHSVLYPALQLASKGWQVRTIPVNGNGLIAAPDVGMTLAANQTSPAIISIMLANNESGVVQDIATLASEVKRSLPSAQVHSDAVQALGKIPLDFRQLNAAGVDALSITAHKIGGPQGAAALIVDKKVELEPLISGGSHERALRAGTENVAAIVGFGVAAELATAELSDRNNRLIYLRDYLEEQLQALGAVIFAAEAPRLSNTSYFSLAGQGRGIEGETMVTKLDRNGFALASGAACSSQRTDTGGSHVLAAMQVDNALLAGAMRVSLGAGNDKTDIDGFIAAMRKCISELAAMPSVNTFLNETITC